MSIRDLYINLLEKTAASGEDLEFDHSIDSRAVAEAEHESNRGDTRSTLMGLFDQAGAVESGQTRTMNRLLKGTGEKETSAPLLKLAFAQLMGEIQADPNMTGAAYLSFMDELEKIADYQPNLTQAEILAHGLKQDIAVRAGATPGSKRLATNLAQGEILEGAKSRLMRPPRLAQGSGLLRTVGNVARRVV